MEIGWPSWIKRFSTAEGMVPFLAVSASEYCPAPFPSRTVMAIGSGTKPCGLNQVIQSGIGQRLPLRMRWHHEKCIWTQDIQAGFI